MSGIYINKLMLIGPSVKSAWVNFEKGLNVVTGPSDSGKTYIYECLNFMMGSSQPPKEIEESRGYESALLEFKSANDTYTLERNLKGGEFRLYQSNITSRNVKNSIILKELHKAGTEDNISGFLLKESGFKNPSWLKKNQNNKKVSLSFRHLINYFAISEERIITKESPIHSGQNTNRTLENSLIKFLLTGEDDSDLEEKEKPEIRKARMQAKLEVLDELINETKKKLKSYDTSKVQGNVQNGIPPLKKELDFINSNIDSLNENRREIWNELKTKESRIVVIKELISRFNLLEEQYKADLERLNFILEGTHYFSQLNTTRCPFCGKRVDEDECDYSLLVEHDQIIESCTTEINKINSNVGDLKKSFRDLENEKQELLQSINSNKKHYDEINSKIEEILGPKAEEINKRIDILINESETASQIKSLKEELDNLQSTYENIKKKVHEKTADTTTNIDVLSIINESEFRNYISDILDDWNFENKPSVTFEEVKKGKSNVLDVKINDKKRSDYGKGYRALLYSAFVIALAQYCKREKLPHPGIVILDSPVTTFKEAKANSQDRIEEVPDDIQTSFFENLSLKYNDEQIIIFENKMPPKNSNSEMNLIEFTRTLGVGRYGFFDPNNGDNWS